MSQYWFARRHPLGAMRAGMVPVSWQGWALRVGFVLALAVASGVGAWIARDGNPSRGVAIAALLAGVAWLAFLRIAHTKGDHVRSAREFRADERTGAGREKV